MKDKTYKVRLYTSYPNICFFIDIGVDETGIRNAKTYLVIDSVEIDCNYLSDIAALELARALGFKVEVKAPQEIVETVEPTIEV